MKIPGGVRAVLEYADFAGVVCGGGTEDLAIPAFLMNETVDFLRFSCNLFEMAN